MTWQQTLVDAAPTLRVAVYVLTIVNLLWLVPLFIVSLFRQNISGFPNAEMALPVSSILLGVLGFQHGAVMEGIPKLTHWSDSVNLLLIAVGLVLLLLFRTLRWLDQLAIARRRQGDRERW